MVIAKAHALLAIPTTIADNAGLDSAEIIAQLCAKHHKEESHAGIDVFIGSVSRNKQFLGKLREKFKKPTVVLEFLRHLHTLALYNFTVAPIEVVSTITVIVIWHINVLPSSILLPGPGLLHSLLIGFELEPHKFTYKHITSSLLCPMWDIAQHAKHDLPFKISSNMAQGERHSIAAMERFCKRNLHCYHYFHLNCAWHSAANFLGLSGASLSSFPSNK
ncbi:hypothetical protein OSB04_027758 [Centaurea solstitialis]|uniref:T-complex protein 1 subunit beta n=1 Tax=Centaurea solstitialis TaxID=347529 RepID=A0AA38VX07_9ASTR|nr:hypothetical protein OSB04_027758 [Centaurea solstitialis]